MEHKLKWEEINVPVDSDYFFFQGFFLYVNFIEFPHVWDMDSI